MSITDSTVTNNEAKKGGFLHGNMSDLILYNSTFNYNRAQDGAVFKVSIKNGTMINLCSIENNFITTYEDTSCNRASLKILDYLYLYI